MALAFLGWEVKIELVDRGNQRMTKTYQLNGTAGTDFTTATAAVTTIVTALGGVTDLAIAATRLTYVMAENALVLPTAAQKEDQAIVAFQILNNPQKEGNFVIPGPKIAIFNGTIGEASNIVNVSNAALVTYSNLFTTGGVALISDGEQLDYMIRGNRRHVYHSFG